jgi:hypothetical protein
MYNRFMKNIYLIFITIFVLLFKALPVFALEAERTNNFLSDVKNYVYKNQLKVKNQTIIKDLTNIKIKILKQINQAPSLYDELQNFAIANRGLSYLFNDMLKDLKEKQKFEILQKHSNNGSNATLIKRSKTSLKYRLTMAEQMFYYFKFTSRFVSAANRFIEESPEILKEYESIKIEFSSIEDIETLKQKGPALCKRCEKLLLNQTGGFHNIERFENVAIIAAAINVRLNSDDWESADSSDLKIRLINRLAELYRLAPHFKHKCLLTIALSNAYLNIGLPHEALSASYSNKNDFYDKLTDNEKADFIWYMANNLALECSPGNERSLKIGIECFYECCRLIDADTGIDENAKANRKAEIYLEATSVLYEKNEKYFEAITELNKIINDDKVYAWIKNNALEKKKALQTFLTLKINVLFSNEFMSGKWKIIDKPYKYIPLLAGQKLKLKVELEQPSESNIQFDSVNWYGEIQTAEQEFELSFSEPGKKRLRVEVELLGKTITRSFAVYVKNKPEGLSDVSFAKKNPIETFKALSKKLIGAQTMVEELEPFKWAAETYKNNGSHNGIQDAARHAYWNCLLTRYFGEDYAKGITDGHEVNTSSELFAEVIMDLHNNEEGRKIAQKHSHDASNNYDCCRNAVINAVRNGYTLYFDDLANSNKDVLLLPTNNK